MDQEFLDKLEAMDLGGRQPGVEKGLLDLPADLMHEVFGPLDARSLLETANSHDTLRKQVMDWPEKRWEIVHLSKHMAIIDYETFDRKDADILLENAQYVQDEGSSVVDETVFNIRELPMELVWPILDRINDTALLTLADGNSRFFRAAATLKAKRFYGVQWLADGVSFVRTFDKKWTQAEAETLLAGACVVDLKYDLAANTAPDIRVERLTFQGDRSYAHKCAGLIEKWKPTQVTFPRWNSQTFNANPDLPRVLKDVEILYINALSVDWLLYIPEWKFTELRFHVSAGRNNNITPQIQAMFQKLYDQWVSRERDEFLIRIYVDSKIDRFRVGPHYPERGDEPDTARRGDDMELELQFFHAHCFSMTSSLTYDYSSSSYSYISD